MKTALVTGGTGQVGSYICELLLNNGYTVHALRRRSSSFNTSRINHIFDHPNLKLLYGDVTDAMSISTFVADAQADIFINCAAQSHVAVSFHNPIYTVEATGVSVFNCLEAIKKYSPHTHFVTMSSSEMFGSTPPPQNENTPFHPRSPYAVAKLTGYYAAVNYREMGLFASNAICFNTESPRRGETFVTRKITRAATRIKLGLQDCVYLGNLDAKRDWSHAIDTSNAIYKIVTATEPDDYVIASGEMHSVAQFAEIVFDKLGLDYHRYVKFDSKYLRPTEVDALCGDATKLRENLGWKPEYSFEKLVDEMVECDMELAKQEKLILDNKHK